MESTDFNKQYAQTSEAIVKPSADAAVIGSIAVNFLLASSVSVVWGIINTLQAIIYLPLIEVDFPSNVKFLYSIILPLSSLDVIPPEYSTEFIFDIS